MTIKVYSFRSSIPAKINTAEKSNIIQYFNEGVQLAGDHGRIITDLDYDNCDVGLIIGSFNSDNHIKTRLNHYQVRKLVVDRQTARGRYWASADSNVFIYLDRNNPKKYLRYSFNGVNPAQGIYCNDRYTDENWNNIKRDYGIDLKAWRTGGNHILLCIQRPLGWSMRGLTLDQWLGQTIQLIRQHSDRPIVMRWHPGDAKSLPTWHKQIMPFINKNTSLSPIDRPITDDLKNAWAVVCHNSTPASVAAIEGIPCFISDQPQYSMAGAVANTDFAMLETPNFLDRQQWIRQLAQCHWSFEDLRSGRAWRWMRQWVKPAVPGSR